MKSKISISFTFTVFLVLSIVLQTSMVIAQDSAPDCGTEPVTLRAYFETGFDIPFRLAEEFSVQYPNVTWDISQDQFTNLINSTPRLLSGESRPTVGGRSRGSTNPPARRTDA